MNQAAENILQAVQTMIDVNNEKQAFDKTIVAKVYAIKDLEAGEYQIEYQGAILTAYSTGKYRVGDSVYVKVPQNDFSARKTIEQKADGTLGLMNELTNVVIPVSPVWSSTNGELGLRASGEASTSVRLSAPQFNIYSKTCQYLQVSAEFLTQFLKEHTIGEYGIEYVFNTISGGTMSYRLAFEQFNGQPYRFSTWAPQSAILPIVQGSLESLASVTFFCEGFKEEATTVDNIFARNIQLAFVDRKDLTDTPYYLYISAPSGLTITNSTSTVLSAHVLENGSEISTRKATKWYVADPSVTSASASGYEKNGGIGWRFIDDTETLTVDATLAPTNTTCRCVVVVADDVTCDASVQITNTSVTVEPAIARAENSALQVIDKQTGEQLSGDWYVYLIDGTYSSVATGKSELSISNYFAYPQVIFYCVTDYGTAKYELVQTDDSDVVVSFQGDDPYHYDANGDVPYEQHEEERVIKPIVTWQSGKVDLCDAAWYLGSIEIGNTMVSPSDSLMENIWVDQNGYLRYNIKQKYRNTAVNNIVEYRLTSRIDGTVYSFKKEVIFLKDGDQGTNGTTYVLVVRPVEGGTLQAGYRPLIYSGSGWAQSQTLKAIVYQDGVEYSEVSSYTLTVDNANGLQDGNQITVSGAAASLTPSPVVVKATATLNDGTILTAMYPVPVQINTGTVEISGLPRYIQYTSSGVSPLYKREDISFTVGGTVSTDIASLTTDLLTIVSQRIRPVATFIGDGNSVALVQLKSGNVTVYWPICYYLNKYGNEAINGWDGVSIDINDGHILAPQVGAGKKVVDETTGSNLFTGVVMGANTGATDPTTHQALVGLYGFQKGKNTFGLTENGDAYFGVGGQIKIDGSDATITGGNGGNSALGMTIDLTGTSSSDAAIKVGAGKFQVNYDGSTKASDISITGGSLDINNGQFKVTSDGNFTSQGTANISGDVTLGGNINMTGNINWGSSQSPVKVLYGDSDVTSSTGVATIGDYQYAIYSYDGGNTWTAPVKVVGSDGARGATGASGESADLDVYQTYIDEYNVKSPQIKGGIFKLLNANGSTRGYMGRATGNTGLSETEGICIAAGTEDTALANTNYFIATTGGVRMQSGDCSIYVISTGCYCQLADGTVINLGEGTGDGVLRFS